MELRRRASDELPVPVGPTMSSSPLQLPAIFLGLIAPIMLLLLLPLLCSSEQSAATITHLPGFHGALPFHLETGYVTVDEANGGELFYYFVQSERNPLEDPVVLWLPGGQRCSVLTNFLFQVGPLKFVIAEYNGSLPTLVLNPYSWTHECNIIFLDSPVGAGFSFSRSAKGYEVGDITSSKQVYTFLKKWFTDHPQFLSNPLYISGISYAGIRTPIVTQQIAQGIEDREQPLLNLQGYVIGNPAIHEHTEKFARVPYANRMGIISDELYELIEESCEGEDDYENPRGEKCVVNLDIFKEFISEINNNQILEPQCTRESPKPKDMKENRRSLSEEYEPSPFPGFTCRSDAYTLLYYWANNKAAREALHIKEGTIEEWVRCNNGIPFTSDVTNIKKYHLDLTTRGYRALVYSGDHDLVIPFIGTEAWIKSLNFSIVDDWRSWHTDGQVAGYTRSYANNLTYATVKGAGHSAPEYRPKQCLDMIRRWISHEPL